MLQPNRYVKGEYTDMPGTRPGQEGTFEENRRSAGHPTPADLANAFVRIANSEDLRTTPPETECLGYCVLHDGGMADYSPAED